MLLDPQPSEASLCHSGTLVVGRSHRQLRSCRRDQADVEGSWMGLSVWVRPSNGGKSRYGGINSPDLGEGSSREPEGIWVWQEGGGTPGPSRWVAWGQKAASSAFSLYFRSPMSLPSTSTPPTPSAQVSIKPPCTCPAFTPGRPPGWREGKVQICIPFSSPLPITLLKMTDGERVGGWSQAALDSGLAAALSWLCDLGESTAPP